MGINLREIKIELVNFLRNLDVFSITQRGQITYTDTGTFSGDSDYTFSHTPTKVKNVRSLIVGANTLKYGRDYILETSLTNNVITFTGKILFVAAQTGNYTIIYDAGTGDKIFTDFPRDDLSIGQYPRIAIDISNMPIDSFGIGGTVFISDITIQVAVYDFNTDNIDYYCQLVKDGFLGNTKSLYYMKFIKPSLIGPIIEDESKSKEIMHRLMEFTGKFNVDGA